MASKAFQKVCTYKLFGPCSCPQQTPVAPASAGAKRSLGVSYGQLQAKRKFPTSRCKRLWKTWDLIKTRLDQRQIDRFDLLKKFIRINFLPLALAHNKPRSLQPVLSQALPWGKLWTTASREEVFHKPCKLAVENLRSTSKIRARLLPYLEKTRQPG